jgi:hypothetical protein
MKKLFFLLLAGVTISFSYAQKTKAPGCITKLGEPYITNFLSLTANLQTIEKDLYAKKGQFRDMTSLLDYSYSKYAGLAGQKYTIDKPAILSNLSKINRGATNYPGIINSSNVSSQLKAILNPIIAGAITIQNDADLNNLLETYSNSINNYGLNSQEKETLKQFIVGYYANYVVLINSNFLKDKMGGAGGITEERRWWQVLLGAVQCALGTVGGALVGGVSGAAAGTVTLPVIGTVSGLLIGVWGGAMAGAAASCF